MSDFSLDKSLLPSLKEEKKKKKINMSFKEFQQILASNFFG